MKSMYINPSTYDLDIVNGQIRMTADDNENLAQKIEARLTFFAGEWFLDRDIGVPYYERILKKNPNYNDVNTLLSTVVATTPGVKELISFDATFETTTREYIFNFEVRTEFGGVIQRGVLL